EEKRLDQAFLRLITMCLRVGNWPLGNWPLTPLGIFWISPPALKKAFTCWSMSRLETEAIASFLAGDSALLVVIVSAAIAFWALLVMGTSAYKGGNEIGRATCRKRV